MTRTHRTKEEAAVLSSLLGMRVLHHLCQHPHQATSAGSLATRFGFTLEDTEETLDALVSHRLAVCGNTDGAKSLYQLTPSPLVWKLAEAHTECLAG